MNVSVHQRIRILIEETKDAYGSYDTVNADFAEFAGLALAEFKNVLDQPDLTREQLTRILRKGMTKHQDKDDTGTWSVFMAHHIANAANAEAKTPKTGFAAWSAPTGDEMKTTETA